MTTLPILHQRCCKGIPKLLVRDSQRVLTDGLKLVNFWMSWVFQRVRPSAITLLVGQLGVLATRSAVISSRTETGHIGQALGVGARELARGHFMCVYLFSKRYFLSTIHPNPLHKKCIEWLCDRIVDSPSLHPLRLGATAMASAGTGMSSGIVEWDGRKGRNVEWDVPYL